MRASWRHPVYVVVSPWVRRGVTPCTPWRTRLCTVAHTLVHRSANGVRRCGRRVHGSANTVRLVDRREAIGLAERGVAREPGDRGGLDLIEQDVSDVVVDGGGDEAGIRRAGIHAGVAGARECGLVLERADDEGRDGPADAHRMERGGHEESGGGPESLNEPVPWPGIEEAGSGFAPFDGVVSQLDAFQVQNVSDLPGGCVEELREAGEGDAGLPVHPEEVPEGLRMREAWLIRAGGHGAYVRLL